MAYWSAAFLFIALAAGVMGAGGFAGLAGWGLFLAGLVLAVFALVLEHGEGLPTRGPDGPR
jgi:hypothetical protein